jgi:NAD(P)-dependent dehydrogenase (short-subunit alcohol dehydrogenase family)
VTISTHRLWLATGASRGLGRASTESTTRSGDLVVATVRHPGALADLAEEWGDRVGAVGAMPFSGMYNTTKWGLEGFSAALAQEVASHGIGVHILQLGGFANSLLELLDLEDPPLRWVVGPGARDMVRMAPETGATTTSGPPASPGPLGAEAWPPA